METLTPRTTVHHTHKVQHRHVLSQTYLAFPIACKAGSDHLSTAIQLPSRQAIYCRSHSPFVCLL